MIRKETSDNNLKMLGPSDFVSLLNISRRTFQTWRAAGKLPQPDLHIGKVIRWKSETIQEWLNNNNIY